MKNKFTGSLCVLMCIMLVFSMFAACSVKDKNGDSTTAATLTPEDSWAPGIADYVYESITVSKVELVDLVKEALGDEFDDDWNGDLNTLTPEQLQKVEEHAKNEGLKVEKDNSGNTVIKKEEMVTTEASRDEINQLMTKASVKDPSNISDEEYERLSQVAQSEGYIFVTKPPVSNKNDGDTNKTTNKNNDIVIAKPVTTIKAAPTTKAPVVTNANNNKTEKATAAPVVTQKPVPKTTSVYKPAPTPGTVAPMAPSTTAIPASTRDWTSTFKKSTNEIFVDSVATNDGGAVFVGITFTSNTGTIDDGGNSSGLIVKYDKKGKVDWSKIIGGSDITQFESVDILPDGSIVAAGYTIANDLEGAGEYKCPDTIEGIVAKFSPKGDLIGNIKIYGGSSDDMIYAIKATPDGGYIIGGNSDSVDGDMDGLNTLNSRKSFVYKCNANGAIVWRSVLNSKYAVIVHDIEINDAGCVYAAVECAGEAFYGTKSLSGTSDSAAKSTVILKLSASGNLEWYRTIYGTGMTSLLSLAVSDDGGCVAAGQYSSGRNGNEYGTFEGIHNAGTAGTADGMLVKLNPTGDANGEGVIAWTCPLRGFETDLISGITKIKGGYAVSGYTKSTNRDFDMMPGTGDYDAFVYIVTDYAALKHVYTYNGSGSDNARTICSNGKSVFVGGSTNSGDVAFAECGAKGTKDEAVAFASCLTFVD